MSEKPAARWSEPTAAGLQDGELPGQPWPLLHCWLSEAQSVVVDEGLAMFLASVDAQGRPHARMLLLRGVDEHGLLFFSHYQSAKGRSSPATRMLRRYSTGRRCNASCESKAWLNASEHCSRTSITRRGRGPVGWGPGPASRVRCSAGVASWRRSSPCANTAFSIANHHGRQTGVVTACCRSVWNSGRRARRACMTVITTDCRMASGCASAWRPDEE